MSNLARLRWAAFSGLMALGLVLGPVSFTLPGTQWKDALLNLATEMIGAAVTFLLFGLIIEQSEKREARRQEREARKAGLIAQMGSRVNHRAIAAVEELWRRGWLPDGLPRKVVLLRASLQDAPLGGAYLPEAVLCWANLSGANLSGTDLSGVNLFRASLTGACLSSADLSSADLTRAEVDDKQLAEARSLAGATLPDGTKLSKENWQAEFEKWCEERG